MRQWSVQPAAALLAFAAVSAQGAILLVNDNFTNAVAATQFINDVVVTFVPEPSAALLGGLGLLALPRCRR